MLNVRQKAIALVCCAAAGLFGCGDPAPRGQVVAIANGEEITSGELRAEVAARDAATPADALRAMVDRKLLAHAARQAGRDQNIAFILARRRSEEALLADLEIGALRDSVAAPSDEDIDRFLQQNPTVFLNQTLFSVDQINVLSRGDPAVEQRLSKAKSLDEVSAMLSRMGILGQRSRTEWNSLFMPASLATRLASLPPDRLFVQRAGETVIAANVVAKTSVSLEYADRRTLVRQSLTQEKVKATITARIAALQASADIRLQPGFSMVSPP